MNVTENIFTELYNAYPLLLPCKESISAAYGILCNAAKANALIMVCGNGGSAADSGHIVGELMKGFNLKRPLSTKQKLMFGGIDGGEEIADKLQGAIRAVSLASQTELISACANDIDASLIYAQQVFAYASQKEDVLIALSTSGNSANIINAVKTAKAKGIKTLAITGKTKNTLFELCDVCILLPEEKTFKVQELTLPVYHALCAALENEMFG